MDTESTIKPIIYKDRSEISSDVKIVENYEHAIKELFFIEHPEYKKDSADVKDVLENFIKNVKVGHIWVYYPTHSLAIHTVEEEVYYKLRTARNRLIITPEVQNKYRDLKVGIAGLSIGSVILSSIVATGGSKVIKITDYDTIEISNLNRMAANLLDIGKNKAIVAAQRVWQLDPFADIYIWESGVNENNLEEYILGNPKLDVFIDEWDSLDLKILARLICKNNGIPVFMATSNGDGVILDIERYDLEPNLAIFNGRLGDVKRSEYKYKNYKEWLNLATKIVNPALLTTQMQKSVQEIGKTISGVPQLSSTVNIGGASIVYALRKLAASEELKSGRYLIGLETIL
ncbi:MAG: hypothetical protein RI947_998 [Candidatus Parcubacteria bacterium]|jgi:hypothetical protein